MWLDPPNQPTRCAKICVVEPEYSSERIGSLLTFAAPALPLVACAKESAALVLLPVSAASVVVGLIDVDVGGWGAGSLPPPPAPPPPHPARAKIMRTVIASRRANAPPICFEYCTLERRLPVSMRGSS